jgi:hypothetical protein
MIKRDQLYFKELQGQDEEYIKFFKTVYFYFMHQKTLNPDTLAKHFLMCVSIVICMLFLPLIFLRGVFISKIVGWNLSLYPCRDCYTREP